jgi:hypothetical protein
MVFQLLQPPVFATANEPTGEFDGLSSTTSTRPLTPPAAPEATLASNWVEPDEPKLMLLFGVGVAGRMSGISGPPVL